MHSLRTILFTTLATFAVAGSVRAQQVASDTARIAPVEVTATRSPLRADHTPSSVSVVTGEQLRSRGVTTVSEALRTVPGLSVVQTGSYGGAT